MSKEPETKATPAVKSLLDALQEFASVPDGPIPIDLTGTLMSSKQGEFFMVVLDFEDRQILNDTITAFNTKNKSDYWMLFSAEIVEAACLYGVTDKNGTQIFNSKLGKRVLKKLHPALSRTFWHQVMSLNGFFPETNKHLVKNSSGTENSNGNSDSALCSDVEEQSYPSTLEVDPSMDVNSSSGEPITV